MRPQWLFCAPIILILNVSAAGEARAQTCTPSFDASYDVRFVATWSAQTLPQQFPPNPHFSGLVGGVHNGLGSFWEAGTTASNGIEQMAETGSQSQLISEVNGAISANVALQVIVGGGIGVSPGATALDFAANQDFSRVTIVSMIAPSADWFVGVSGLELFTGGNWVASVTVPLFGFDAGTDSGTTYTSPNQDTQPAQPIAPLDGPMFRVNNELVPFGRFEFTRTSESCVDNDADGVADEDDNCLFVANSEQTDGDGDGHGNACDADLNNDCIVNTADLGVLRTVFFGADASADFNADGVVNVSDLGIMKNAFFAAPGPSANGDCTL